MQKVATILCPIAALNLRRMKLSVIDQAPVPSGFTPGCAAEHDCTGAFDRSTGLRALLIAEHHAMPTLACTAPEVLLARVGAETRRIRIGSGGVMLPHYSPLKVAEQFRVLHALYRTASTWDWSCSGRKSLDSHALRRERVDRRCRMNFPEQLIELLAFLHNDFPRSIRSPAFWFRPQCRTLPMYGYWFQHVECGRRCATRTAVRLRAFHFAGATRAAIEHYAARFKPSRHLSTPQAIVALGAICAETDEAAIRLMASARLMRRRRDRGEWLPIPTVAKPSRNSAMPRCSRYMKPANGRVTSSDRLHP